MPAAAERSLTNGKCEAPREQLRLAQHNLNIADTPLGETSLAISEVKRPDTPETLVIAEVGELLDIALEVRAPVAQCVDVVRR